MTFLAHFPSLPLPPGIKSQEHYHLIDNLRDRCFCGVVIPSKSM